MRAGPLRRSIGAGSKIGCVLDVDFRKVDGPSFMEKSVYGHICTVNGALWQLDGFFFDATDDYVNCPDHSDLQNIFDGGGCLEAVVLPNSDGEGNYGRFIAKTNGAGGWIAGVSGEVSGAVDFELYQYFTGTDGYWVTTATQIPIKSRKHVAVIYDADSVGNDPMLITEGTTVGITESDTPTVVRSSDAGIDLRIGNQHDQSKTFDGLIVSARLDRQPEFLARILQRAIDSRRN